MTISGDDARVACPLFQEEYGGSIPTSPLQLNIVPCSLDLAIQLNKLWHSRLPYVEPSNVLRNTEHCEFVAEHGNVYYACAIWSSPVARTFNGRGYLELRRMAIASDAPKNTASRMIKVMRLWIQHEMPWIVKLISYQDTDVHTGTIYKASGWTIGGMKRNIGNGWLTRERNIMQTISDKIRWEYDLREAVDDDDL